MTAMIRAESIGRCTKSGQWLIRNIDLQIDAGERVAIVGPTGSGKTVLLRCLALLDQINTGKLYWKGEPLTGDIIPGFRRLAIHLGQRPAFVEGSIETNLRRVYEFHAAKDQTYDSTIVAALLDALQLPASFLLKHPNELSGGERQLAALIRALQLHPELLMLDEPTASLDAAAAINVETVISNWQNEVPTRTTIWVSHDAEQRTRVAERFIELPQ